MLVCMGIEASSFVCFQFLREIEEFENIERMRWVACQQTCVSSYSVSLLS
jgi:hypothetical protein